MNSVNQRRLIWLLPWVMMSGCMHASSHARNPADPWETWNRKIYRFNKGADRLFFKPTAKAYQHVVPAGFQKAFRHFLNNVDDVVVMCQDFLQGQFRQARLTGTRFVINTTWGILGFSDRAARAGLPKRENDFGITLGVWGFKRSPYMVLPVIGPSTTRDGLGRGANVVFNPTWYADDPWIGWGYTGGTLLDTRVQYLEKENLLHASALDEYTFVRDAYLQKRQHLIARARPSAATAASDPAEGAEDAW